MAVVVGAILAATAGTLNAAAAPAARSTLSGSMPSWANATARAGSPSDSTRVDFRVYLQNRDQASAAVFAMAVSTPGNAAYRKFLTPAQYRARFSPTSDDAAAVSSWLKGQGFTVGAIPDNHKYVEASGTLGQAAKSFNTSFGTYRVKGKTLRANASPLSVPRTLPQVQAVLGLDDSAELVQPNANPPAGFRNARPCSAYWGEKTVQNTPTPDGTKLPASPSAFAPCGYAGVQLQGAYGLASTIAGGTDGTGVTVAVIDAYASATVESDANTYFDRHGLPTFKPGQFRQDVPPGTSRRPENPRQHPESWSGEETLDIEAVHTMAPGANIVYVGAPNNYRDMDAIMNRVVDKHVADIVTNSYGYSTEALPTGYIKPQEDTYIQAAAEGISLFFSSGDNGDETRGVSGATPTPDWPASSPWVTAVGGTSLGVTQNNTRLFELGWETGRSSLTTSGSAPSWSTPSYLYGAGGGTSRIFAQPDYQAGVVPDSIARRDGGAAMRVVPDVAAVGDPNTGMLIGQTQTFPDGAYYDEYRIGGTSLSSPLYAGMFALAVQRHGPYGLANPALYAARNASYDITKAQLGTYPGDVRVDYTNGVDASNGYTYTARWFDVDTPLTIHVRPGYDDITGIGSPNGTAWLTAVTAYR
ncbi:MAG TPA: S53 family peptidase [Microlunatus sp.]|nr:S53 family peptidase [Microlunatus sp.]